jgi:hypothetical protein
MSGPLNVSWIKLDTAGTRTLPSFAGALHFVAAYSGATRTRDDRFTGGADAPGAILWLSIAEEPPVPIKPGQSFRVIGDREKVRLIWDAQAGVVAHLIEADPERFEADFQ